VVVCSECKHEQRGYLGSSSLFFQASGGPIGPAESLLSETRGVLLMSPSVASEPEASQDRGNESNSDTFDASAEARASVSRRKRRRSGQREAKALLQDQIRRGRPGPDLRANRGTPPDRFTPEMPSSGPHSRARKPPGASFAATAQPVLSPVAPALAHSLQASPSMVSPLPCNNLALCIQAKSS
jgi:hypothetical protein